MTQWKLKKFMEDHRIKPGDLARATEGKLSRTSIYSLMQDDRPRGINFATLDALIPALSRILKEPVEITDLITYGDESEEAPQRKRAWRKLRGALNDPDSPGDIAARHDHYLGETLHQEHQEGVEGKR